jgi:hypothetical protein
MWQRGQNEIRISLIELIAALTVCLSWLEIQLAGLHSYWLL